MNVNKYKSNVSVAYGFDQELAAFAFLATTIHSIAHTDMFF